jgi:hypothetical protein
MAQRVLKIILPASEKKHAVEMLESEEKTIYWREEDSEDIFIVSALTEAGHSERIMDNFQRYYSSTSGFQIVVFPVEASVPMSPWPFPHASPTGNWATTRSGPSP